MPQSNGEIEDKKQEDKKKGKRKKKCKED